MKPMKVNFVTIDWLMDCIANGKMVDCEKYKVDYVYDKLESMIESTINDESVKRNRMNNHKAVDPFFDDIVSSKYLIEIINEEGTYYLYNCLTGYTSYSAPTNFKEKLFCKTPGMSIMNDMYYGKEETEERNNEIKTTVESYEKSIAFIDSFQKNVEVEIEKSKNEVASYFKNLILEANRTKIMDQK